MPGMAAAEAGLQANDVLVSVDGQPVVDYPSLVSAIQGKRAGDTVQVGYLPGQRVPQRSPWTLSGRLLPEIPATPVEPGRPRCAR